MMAAEKEELLARPLVFRAIVAPVVTRSRSKADLRASGAPKCDPSLGLRLRWGGGGLHLVRLDLLGWSGVAPFVRPWFSSVCSAHAMWSPFGCGRHWSAAAPSHPVFVVCVRRSLRITCVCGWVPCVPWAVYLSCALWSLACACRACMGGIPACFVAASLVRCASQAKFWSRLGFAKAVALLWCLSFGGRPMVRRLVP